jgi:C1A family cysteine protease
MKIFNYFLIFVLIFLFLPIISAIANPATKFCLENGNSYEEKIDKNGNEYGNCVVNGKSTEEWNYYSANSKQTSSTSNLEKTTTIKDNKRPKSTLRSTSPFLSADRSANPPTLDWRNNSGKNFVSPIKDQGSCGACWAFASVAIVESKANIDLSTAYNTDLSEQDVITNNNLNSSCSGGYEFEALTFIKDSGIVKETCMPYTQTDTGTKCANGGVLKINNYTRIGATSTNIKTAINDYGPITAYLIVCYDHFTGTEIYGVQNHLDAAQCETGGNYNWHAISIVGYNDTGEYWIVKNSWGTGWGNLGYIRISYNNSVYNYGTWLTNNSDYRVLFLDDSYYVNLTDVQTIPTINSTSTNATAAKSSQALNFSAFVKANSIKNISSVILNALPFIGNFSHGGFFNLISNSTRAGCPSNIEQSCSLMINVTDDANISSTENVTIFIDDIAPKFYSINNYTLTENTNFTANINATDGYLTQFIWIESNHTGVLQNYTYFINESSKFISKNFTVTVPNSFFYRWWSNDSVGNFNYTTWAIVNLANNPPINLTIPNLNWTINSNYTLNLRNYFSDPDGNSLTYTSDGASNLTISINQETGIATLIPQFNFSGVRIINFLANDSINTTRSSNITISIFRPIINFSVFDGSTTNFSNLNSFVNVTFIIEKISYGKLNFSNVNLTLENYDFSNNINISDNYISVNSSNLVSLNMSAILSLYNITFLVPIIYRDGQICSSNFCNQLNYSNNIFIFNVSSFSNYTTQEAFCGDSVCSSSASETCSTCASDCGTCPVPNTGSGGGGGGGGGGSGAITLNDSALSSGILKKFNIGEKINLRINEQNHSIQLNKISNGSVNITIKSDPINFMLLMGEYKKLNLTSPEYYDLYVKLENLNLNHANITIKKINEKMSDATSKPIVNTENGVDNQSLEKARDSNNTPSLLIVYSIVIFVIIVLLIFLFRGIFNSYQQEK